MSQSINQSIHQRVDYLLTYMHKGEDDQEKRRDRTGRQEGKITTGNGRGVVLIFKNVVASLPPVTLLHHFILTNSKFCRVSNKYIMQNAEFRPRTICGISDAEKTC